MDPTAWPPLIRALCNPTRYPHPVGSVEVLETHISWVLLTGDYAYKIKKPVNLGFLDFSTLERRRHFCQEELRLNCRFAPQLYEDVVGISGTPTDPQLCGTGEPLEYAVRMKQFANAGRLDHVLARGELQSGHIDDLAAEIARQHGAAGVAGDDRPFGRPDVVLWPVTENFAQIRRRLTDAVQRARLDRLDRWTHEEFRRRLADFEKRKAGGQIRECHGDLHLANMVLLEGRVTLFDCLEFSEALRWIDVQSDLAFAVMDLEDRGRPHLARRLLNAYLEQSGDYSGLAVLPYYLVYRALVRATVAAIRAGQEDIASDERSDVWQEFAGYLALAERYAQPRKPVLCITYGLSGAGKTHFTQQLLECLGAIRVRSDVERKRLAGLPPSAQTAVEDIQKMYGEAATRATYDRLVVLTRQILTAGCSTIVDATFLRHADRDIFRKLAGELHVHFLILEFQTDAATLRRRVTERRATGRDASEATLEVLEQQLQKQEILQPDERPFAFAINSAAEPSAIATALMLRVAS